LRHQFVTTSSARPLRIGVAGLGFGAAVHVPALRDLPGVEVVAIAGTDRAKAGEVAQHLGVGGACDSIQELLDHDLDALTLALPPAQVASAVRAAFARDIPVLCEKPLGLTIAEAIDLADRATGLIAGVDFQFAELETFLRLKQIVADGGLGRVRHVVVDWLMESWAYRHQTWSWKLDAMRGGGAIALFGSHLFFLAEWLFGPTAFMSARTSNTAHISSAPAGACLAEDLVHCRIQHRDGTVFAATFGNANPGCSLHRWVVVFDNGTVLLENPTRDYMSGFTLRVCGGPLDGEVLGEGNPNGDGRLPPFRRLASRFIECLRSGQPMFPDFGAGVRALAMDAALRSSAGRLGAEEAVEPFLPGRYRLSGVPSA
jgi:predicted dehydrogenase